MQPEIEFSIEKAIPVLEVADVATSMNRYRDMLGFSADPFPEAPPTNLQFFDRVKLN